MGEIRMRFVRKAALAGLLVLSAAGVGWAGRQLVVTNFGNMDPVAFDHTRHAEDEECDVCHHPDKAAASHRCGACHKEKAKGSTLSLEDAAHKEGVGKCWRCHLKKGDPKAFECEVCHRG